ncbi:heme oxygenase (biliverdin-producing) [Phytoactinopolyspora endophytica]|uniref:biliverdin-producing heme oxygenase n=1 Tax=Phytoactinopolyspora endophytica TaxID=1642495 RepID=UPI00101E01A9|nr:biliverdin-producing heme oxygenase [Phytoactinopolyspora endophytica]
MTTVDRPSFSQRLRERSWNLHRQAEGAGFMKALMDGEIERSGYALMVTQHLFIYDALEAVSCDLRDNEIAGPFITERLSRGPSLRADLDALIGTGWLEQVTPLPSTQRYVARIREMADWPDGFVAHHYTRYLGDLSGGLAIGKVVARVYGLDGAGVSFYTFDQIDKPKVFKDEYRARLDAVPWQPDEQERVIDEVLRAYRHNTEVFADLEREVGIGARH